jgi:hypothetical protein
VVQAHGLLAVAGCVICAGVLCLFGAQVEEEFVVGEERGLRVFDLRGLGWGVGEVDGGWMDGALTCMVTDWVSESRVVVDWREGVCGEVRVVCVLPSVSLGF